jgi:hypothetical protein
VFVPSSCHLTNESKRVLCRLLAGSWNAAAAAASQPRPPAAQVCSSSAHSLAALSIAAHPLRLRFTATRMPMLATRNEIKIAACLRTNPLLPAYLPSRSWISPPRERERQFSSFSTLSSITTLVWTCEHETKSVHIWLQAKYPQIAIYNIGCGRSNLWRGHWFFVLLLCRVIRDRSQTKKQRVIPQCAYTA